MMCARLVLALGLAASLTLPACGPAPVLAPGPALWSQVVFVQQRWLELRLSQPRGAATDQPLVLFVTGDGGWRGKDLDAFRHLIEGECPVAGISAPDYLGRVTGGAEALSPVDLARDFSLVIRAAREAFDLPAEGKTLLIGVSRGADLAVVAAAQRTLRPSIGGVLAIGLTREEEYVRRPHALWRGAEAVSSMAGGARRSDGTMMAEPYHVLRRLDLPVALIQSSHDKYVPAAEARSLFGPDTATRRFHAIEARNHSFSNARRELYREMESSLDWLIGLTASHRKGAAS